MDTVEYGWNDSETYSTSYLVRPILKICERFQPKSILDLGCGNGSLTKYIVDSGYNVVACEPDEKGVSIAKQKLQGVEIVQCGVYDDPTVFGDQKFDLIICSEVVEHLYAPEKLMSFARSLLNPKGKIIVTTPYHGYFKNLLISIFDKWDKHHGSLDTGGHIKFWSKKTLERLFLESNFKLVQFVGAGRFAFLWKSMVLVGEMQDAS